MDKAELVSDTAIRKATLEDIGHLLLVCRCCFPDSLRWLSKKLGQRWWKENLLGDASVTWVAEDSGGIVAFCLLVTDEAAWSGRKKCWSTSIPDLLGAFLFHPIAASLGVRQKLKACGKRVQPAIHVQEAQWFSPGSRTWIELIAVDPCRRKQGIAAMLLKHCERTTKELRRKALALRVSSENIPAKCFYESHGFVRYLSDANGHLYMKCVE